jgi:tRNA (pseudouridine54-N1)-methyltransferase
VRSFVVVGQRAIASEAFLLDDLAGSSGRLDVLVRSMRAALLVSHGVRRDTVVYLVLLGGPRAPRTVRIDGATAKFLRPDERSLATLLRKTLASRADDGLDGFVDVRPGISLARGGVDVVLRALGDATLYVLAEDAPDVRDVHLDLDDDSAFFVGDHLGFDDATTALLAARGARPVGLGPVSVHTDDAIAIVSNELDRATTGRAGGAR